MHNLSLSTLSATYMYQYSLRVSHRTVLPLAIVCPSTWQVCLPHSLAFTTIGLASSCMSNGYFHRQRVILTIRTRCRNALQQVARFYRVFKLSLSLGTRYLSLVFLARSEKNTTYTAVFHLDISWRVSPDITSFSVTTL